MTWWFAIFGLLLLGGAAGAMFLRQPVHCALSAAVAFIALASFYVALGAQFAGLAQILVYVGAVAVLLVMAVLLTRGGDMTAHERWSPTPILGIGVAVLVAGALMVCILSSGRVRLATPAEPVPSGMGVVHSLGMQLMTDYVLPLQAVGLLLTVALIGAVLVAMKEKEGKQ